MLGEYFLVFSPFFKESIVVFKKSCIFAPHLRNQHAQMAESVDALVSNTSGFTSIPVRPRVWVLKRRKLKNSLRFSFLLLVTRWFADGGQGST